VRVFDTVNSIIFVGLGFRGALFLFLFFFFFFFLGGGGWVGVYVLK
jgi:hypothetical protein